jgi:hypothetical protein
MSPSLESFLCAGERPEAGLSDRIYRQRQSITVLGVVLHFRKLFLRNVTRYMEGVYTAIQQQVCWLYPNGSATCYIWWGGDFLA